jgi:mannose-6-phosphate isomerase-like protein (cupin superfamily)
MARGYVVAADGVEGRPESGTAETRVTIDRSCGCERLEQRVIRFAPGRSDLRETGDRQEVLYVASGRGDLAVAGESHTLEQNTGAFLVPGAAPCEGERRSQTTVRYADRPVLPASPNREFRFLVNEDTGCLDVTQFVGVIPPGRAPMHSHTYDEVVYVVEGEGVLHLADRETPLGPGSCIHLPPLEEHCLENTGPTPMRVLGVFHPSGDPASRA